MVEVDNAMDWMHANAESFTPDKVVAFPAFMFLSDIGSESGFLKLRLEIYPSLYASQ